MKNKFFSGLGKHIPILLVLVLGLVLRFYHNLNISLWHDEAFSALMIRYPWQEMFYRLGLDVHPPMYYIFLRLWHYVFRDSLLSLRGFSIFFGVGAIWAAWLFTKEAFKSEKAALWAATLVAINPFQLQYVTEARMYTMGAFFALLAGYFLVKALGQQTLLFRNKQLGMPNLPTDFKLRRCMFWNYIGFTLSMIVIIYTHYYLFFTAAALGFYGLLYLYFHHQGTWRKYSILLFSFFAIIISFLPWLKTFLFQYRQVQAGYWIDKMNVWSIPSTFWDMLLGFARDTGKPSTQIMLILVTIFSIYLLFSFVKKTEGYHKWLVLFAVAAPFLGAILFALLARLKGSNSSVYLDRYFLFGSVYFSIAVAVWLKEIPIKWLSTSLFLIYAFLNIIAYAHFWQQLDVATKPGMAEAARFLAQNVEPKQHIFLGTSYEFFNFKYYWSVPYSGLPKPDDAIDSSISSKFINRVRPLLFTGGRAHASEMSHVEGVAMLNDADLVPDFSQAVHSQDIVWMVWTYAFGSHEPAVPLNWTKIKDGEHVYADVRPYVGTDIYVTEYVVN